MNWFRWYSQFGVVWSKKRASKLSWWKSIVFFFFSFHSSPHLFTLSFFLFISTSLLIISQLNLMNDVTYARFRHFSFISNAFLMWSHLIQNNLICFHSFWYFNWTHINSNRNNSVCCWKHCRWLYGSVFIVLFNFVFRRNPKDLPAVNQIVSTQ